MKNFRQSVGHRIWPNCPQHGQQTRGTGLGRRRSSESAARRELLGQNEPRPLTRCSSAPAGGLAAVIYTDALQTFIMLIGALTLMVFSECFPAVLSLKL